jgi:predicted DNA-binding transcriptional regulator YafY
VLLSLLQRHPKGLTLEELASRLNVSDRSLRRYLREVGRHLELVGEPDRDGARRWRLAPSETPRKIDLRRTQAYALLAARPLFESMRGATLFEEIDLASRRLLTIARRPGRGPNAGVADARLEDRFLYVPFAPKNYAAHTETIDDVFQAVADLRPLRGRLFSRDGREEWALLHPYAMVLYKDAIFCVAKHVTRGEVLAFPIELLRDTDCDVRERFELPEGFDARTYVQGQFGVGRGGEPVRVEIDLDPTVAELVASRRLHPSQELAPTDEGKTRLTLHVGDLTEVATWVLGFGATARVVAPAELVERVADELARAAALYARPAPEQA